MIEQFGTLLKTFLEQGSALAILFAFLFGVFVGFTPCVYPVLPVTVSYIGRASRGSKLNGFLYSLVYVLGMALVYAVIGIVAAMAGSQVGKLWSNGWVLLALANLFILLALWQLNVIHIPVPQFVSGGGERRSGFLGALAVGAASGLIVGPCTLPGLAAVLALIQAGVREGGSAGSALFGAAAMFAYSLGLGSLIMICGTFSGFLANLPKSGKWLGVVEKVFAVLMILAAEFFLIHLGQSANFPLLGRGLAAGDVKASTSVSTSEATTAGRAPAPAPSSAGPTTPGGEAPAWTLNDLEDKSVSLADYRGRKGVLMVFFATWCPSCMEEVPHLIAFREKYKARNVELIAVGVDQPAHTFRRFAAEAKVNYRVVVDGGSVVTQRYGVTGIPHIVGIDAGGTIRYVDHVLPKDLDAFVATLEAGGT
jgi:thiol:disulfide interchange protein DsbD